MSKVLILIAVLMGLHTYMSASETVDTLHVKMPTCAVDGKVLYYTGKGDIRDAKIRLVDKSGKEYLTASDQTGLFQFTSLPVGEYELTASHMGYDTFTSKYNLAEGRCVIYIRMKPSEDMIEGAAVIAEAALLRHVADTTIYNAAALRTDAWADALELLKQIPGASVGSNGITINGEPVSRTFVNGTLVFGDNPITAFKQLLASDVTHIKVYDEIPIEDQLVGKKNSRKERVLNVITKNKINLAVRGNLDAAGGLDQNRTIDGELQGRYGAGGDVSLHSEMLQIEIRGGSNNLGEDQPEHFHVEGCKSLSSYSEQSEVSIRTSKYWGERMIGNHIRASYSFGHSYQQDRRRSAQDYFATHDTPALSFRDTSQNGSSDRHHSFGVHLICPKTKIGNVGAKVTMSIKDSELRNLVNRSESTDNRTTVYSENKNDNSHLSNYNMTLRWSHRFGNYLPHFSSWLSWRNQRESHVLIDTLGTMSYPKRALYGSGADHYMYANLTAGTKVYLTNTDRQTIMLDMSYAFELIDDDNGVDTYNRYGVPVPILDIANTFDYKWRTQQHSLDFALFRDTRQTNIEAHVVPLLKTALNTEDFPVEYSRNRSYFAVCPSFSFSYKNRFKVRLTTDSAVPTMQQTRPKVNDAVQSRLSAGNPDLKQSYISRLSISYSSKAHADKPFFEASAAASVTANPIVSLTSFFTEDTILEQYDGYVAKAGSLLTTYSNAPVMATASFNAQLVGQTNSRTPWYVNLSYNYRYLPQFSGAEQVSLNEYTPILRGRYSYRAPFGLHLMMDGSAVYINSRNTEGVMVNESISGKLSLSAFYMFLDRFKVGAIGGTSVYYLINRKTTNWVNTLQVIAEAEILKRRLYLTLSAHDILNSSDSYMVSYTADQLIQNWIPSYGRYFLVGFKWKFRKDR